MSAIVDHIYRNVNFQEHFLSLGRCLDAVKLRLRKHGQREDELTCIAVKEMMDSYQAFSCCHDDTLSDDILNFGREKYLKQKHLLLIGTLQRSSSQYESELVLVDKSGEVVLDFIRGSIVRSHDLGNLAIICDYNFIACEDGTSFVEVLSSPIIVHPKVQVNKILNAVNTIDAGLLLHAKMSRGKSKLVNIHGFVDCVTHVIHVKNKAVFVLQLISGENGCRISILMADERYLHWQKFLWPDMLVTLTELRPTTYNPGTPSQFRLFVPGSNSELFIDGEHTVNLVTLREWYRLNQQEFVDCSTGGAAPCPSHDRKCFQGTITCNKNAHLGEYLLDDKFLLNLSYLLCLSAHRVLRVGTQVMVYNAHLKNCPPKGSAPSVYCCMMGSVKVLKFSPYDTPSKPFVYNSCLPVMPVTLYSLGGEDFKQLLVVEHTLQQKFSPSFMSVDSCCEIFKSIFKNHCPHEDGFGREKMSRQILSEVWSEPHSCPLTFLGKTLPDFPSLETVNKQIKYAIGNRLSTRECTSKTELVVVQVPSRDLMSPVIVGCLKVTKTGTILLADQTGSIPVVVTGNGTQNRQHICAATCGTNKGDDCPYFHVCHNNSIVMLKQFVCIGEILNIANSQNQSSTQCDSERSESSKIYLSFSMCDAVVLSGEQDKDSTVIEDGGGNKHAVFHEPGAVCLSQNTDREKDIDCCDLPLCAQKPRIKRRCTDMTSLEQSTFTEFSQNLYVTHLTSLFSYGTRSNTSELRFYLKCMLVGPTNICVGNEHSYYLNSSLMTDGKAITLSFSGDNVSWFPMMHQGCSYRLTSRCLDDLQSLQDDTIVSTQWLRAENANPVIAFTPTMLLSSNNDSTESSAFMESATPILSVSEICCQKGAPEVVTFVGLVTSKTLMPIAEWKMTKVPFVGNTYNDLLPTSYELMLTVQDLKNDDEVIVYLNLAGRPYILGLVEGVVVEFHGFDWKLTRSGKQSSHFLPTSSVVVRSFENPNTLQERCLLSTFDAASIPRHNLADVWDQKCSRTFVCVCFIDEVYSVEFTSVCLLCTKRRIDGCNHDRLLVAEACIKVDDGSGIAKVYVKKDLVRNLLQLKPNVWNDLEEFVTQNDDLVFKKFEKNIENTFARKLRMLCRSSTVLRPVRLTCDQSKGNKTETDLDTWRKEDFGTFRERVMGEWTDVVCRPLHILQCRAIAEVDSLQLSQTLFL